MVTRFFTSLFLCTYNIVAFATSSRSPYTNVTSPTSGDSFSPTADWQYFVYPPPTAGYHVSTTCTPTYLGDEAPMLAASGETCMLTASSVELYYWPTPYATPSPTTTITPGPSLVTSVGPDGYTYTSPSVYVVYYSLQAWNFMNGAQAGSTYDSLTVAYDPTELSTLYGCSQTVLSTSALNFQDFNMPPRWSVLSQHQRCDTCGQVYQFPGLPHPGDELVSSYSNMTYAYNAMVNGVTSWRLKPDFVIPPSLNDQDPHWQGCNGFTWGVFDPPHALVAASAMVAPPSDPSPSATPASKPPNTGDTAKPAPLPADPSPAQTPAPTVAKQNPPADTKADPPDFPVQDTNSAPGKQSPPVDPNLDSPVNAASDPAQDPAADMQSPPAGPKPENPVDLGAEPSQNKAPDKQSSSSDPKLNSAGNPASDPSQDPAVSNQDPSSDMKPNPPTVQNPPEPTSPQDSSIKLGSVHPAAAKVAVAGHTIGAHPSGGLAIDGTHLSGGSSDTTANGMRIAQNSAGIIIGGNAIQIPSATTSTSPFASLNGQGIAKAAGGGIIVGGSTISSGTKATISNVQVSVGDGSVSVIPTTLPYVAIDPAASPSTMSNSPGEPNQKSNAAPSGEHEDNSPSGPNGPALGIVAAGNTWTPLNHGTLVAYGVTISVGGPALTTSGTVLSMNEAGLMAGRSTIAIPSIAPQTAAAAAAGVFTASGQTFTPLGNHNRILVVNGKTTLDAGAPATTIGGVAMSLGSSALVVGPSTIPLPFFSPPSSSTATPRMIPTTVTAAGHTFTPVGSDQVVVDDGSGGSTTLRIGGAALTGNGTVVSMAWGGLVVGASTTVPVRVTAPSSSSFSSGGGTTTSVGLGGVIMSGFGGSGKSTGPAVFEGRAAAAGGLSNGMGVWVVFCGVCLVVGGRWVT